MIALLSCGFRCLTVAEHLISKHRLADMNTAVVDEIDLHHLSTSRLQKL